MKLKVLRVFGSQMRAGYEYTAGWASADVLAHLLVHVSEFPSDTNEKTMELFRDICSSGDVFLHRLIRGTPGAERLLKAHGISLPAEGKLDAFLDELGDNTLSLSELESFLRSLQSSLYSGIVECGSIDGGIVKDAIYQRAFAIFWSSIRKLYLGVCDLYPEKRTDENTQRLIAARMDALHHCQSFVLWAVGNIGAESLHNNSDSAISGIGVVLSIAFFENAPSMRVLKAPHPIFAACISFMKLVADLLEMSTARDVLRGTNVASMLCSHMKLFAQSFLGCAECQTVHTHLTQIWIQWRMQRGRIWKSLVQFEECHQRIVDSGLLEHILKEWLENTTPLVVEEHLKMPPSFAAVNGTYPLRDETLHMLRCISQHSATSPSLVREVLRVVKRHRIVQMERKRIFLWQDALLHVSVAQIMRTFSSFGSDQLKHVLAADGDWDLFSESDDAEAWRRWMKLASKKRPMSLEAGSWSPNDFRVPEMRKAVALNPPTPEILRASSPKQTRAGSHKPDTPTRFVGDVQNAIDELGDEVLRLRREFSKFSKDDENGSQWIGSDEMGRILVELDEPGMKATADAFCAKNRNKVYFEDFISFYALHTQKDREDELVRRDPVDPMPSYICAVCSDRGIEIGDMRRKLHACFKESGGKEFIVGIKALRKFICGIAHFLRVKAPTLDALADWAVESHHGWPDVQSMEFCFADALGSLKFVLSEAEAARKDVAPAGGKDSLYAAFGKYDVDGDGKITFGDLRRAFDAAGRNHVSDDHLKRWIARRDKSGLGKVSFEDFQDAYGEVAETALDAYTIDRSLAHSLGTRKLEALRKAFGKYDVDGDGRVTFSDLRIAFNRMQRQNVPDSKLLQWIFERDSGGEGYVTFEDFASVYCEGAVSHKSINADDPASLARCRACFDRYERDGCVHISEIQEALNELGLAAPNMRRDIDAFMSIRRFKSVNFAAFCELHAALTGHRNLLESKSSDDA